MSWHTIPGWPDYQINEKGQVRNIRGCLLTPVRANGGGGFYLCRPGQKVKMSKVALLALAFPPAPPPEPVKPSKPETHPEGGKQSEVQKPKRRCATCKRPTHDYRCPACWKKLRGE
jgi:hypothetical protein